MRDNSRRYVRARDTPFDGRSNFVYCPIIVTIVFANVKYLAEIGASRMFSRTRDVFLRLHAEFARIVRRFTDSTLPLV